MIGLSSKIVQVALVGAGMALGMQVLLILQERPVVSPISENNSTLLWNDPIDSHQYNIVDLMSPKSTGPMTLVFSYLVTKSPLGPWIRRHLLNTNGVHSMREFAAQYCRHLPPKHFPVHKATREQMQQAKVWAQTFGDDALKNGYRSSFTGVKDIAPKYREIMDYHFIYKSRRATPTEVMERLINGATQHLNRLNMFSSFRPDYIRKQARESDKRWASGKQLSIWDGVPVAIKDMSPVEGYQICDGSSSCREVFEDDYPAARLRSAGAILVGMTVMTEGGVTPLGYAVNFDGPYNPYNTAYYSGGSSSGSAVAVASGLIPVAIGWDGGGSIRIPASMSGVEGLATTFGRVPFQEASSSTNIKAGPLATTMTDIGLSYLLLSEPHPESFYSDLIGEAYLPQPFLLPPPSQSDFDDHVLEGYRLGVFWEHFRDTDKEVFEKSVQVVHFLESQGATIVNVTIPNLREIHLSHGLKILTEFGIAWESQFYNQSYNLEPNTEITVMLGRTLTADEILAAEKIRHFAIQFVRGKLFSDLRLDAIVSPMLGDKVPKMPDGIRGYGESNTALVYKIMRFVPLANFLGLPGLSIPVGYEKDSGLPIGFQLIGNAWAESTLLRIGSIVEKYQKRKAPPSENFFDVLEPWLTDF